MDDLLVGLVRRLFDARATQVLRDELSDIKSEHDLKRTAFRATGTQEVLLEAAIEAAAMGLLSVERLARLVDEVEENGSQHIFLFDIVGDASVLVRCVEALEPMPSASARLYLRRPKRSVIYRKRSSGVIAKQLMTAEYWERDEDESEDTPDKRVVVYKRQERRAVNLIKVSPDAGIVEVRVDRVRSARDDSLSEQMLDRLLSSLGCPEFWNHAKPLPIWDGYTAMVKATSETYMTTDEGFDQSARIAVHSRRGGRHGTDIRDHQAYDLSKQRYARESLNIYWNLPREGGEGGDDAREGRLHTVLSELDVKGRRIGKIYIAARAAAKEVQHALDRIRHYATTGP